MTYSYDEAREMFRDGDMITLSRVGSGELRTFRLETVECGETDEVWLVEVVDFYEGIVEDYLLSEWTVVHVGPFVV